MKFIQIDMDIFADPKIQLLLHKKGATGLCVYFYCLVQMAHSSLDCDCAIKIDELFLEAAEAVLNIKAEEINDCINELVRINLIQPNDSGYISEGFLNRTGKLLAADIKRSDKMKQYRHDLITKPKANKKPKKSANPEQIVLDQPPPDQPLSEANQLDNSISPEVQKVRDTINDVLALANETQSHSVNAKSTLNSKQINKLIADYGVNRVIVMVRVYFLWKLTTKKLVKNDYLSILQPWVQEKTDKYIQSNPTEFEKIKMKEVRPDRPVGWESWTAEQKREWNKTHLGAKNESN